MIDRRAIILISSIRKLSRRGAHHNVQKILKKAHTPDVATLMEELESEERLNIFRMLTSIDRRASVLSYLKPDVQQELLTRLQRHEVHELVQNMDKDDAADLLAHLPDEVSKEILANMVREDSEEVADLMSYPEDTAGGLMSSDYLALSSEITVEQAIKEIQSREEESFVAIYVYVTDESGSLVGVLSLKDLILSRAKSFIKDIMNQDIISVSVETPSEEVAQIVERYDFLSVPVVESGNRLVGIVTVDDVIDVIREEAKEDLLAMGRAGWGDEDSIMDHLKARTPWLVLAFLGGLICYFIFHWILADRELNAWWRYAAFLPLFLTLGTTAGQQAVTVAVGASHEGFKQLRKHLLNEMTLAFIFSLFFGSLLMALANLFDANPFWALILGGSLALHLMITMIFGTLIPLSVEKIKLDPAIMSVPIFTIISDISAVIVSFGLYAWFLVP